MQTERQVLNFLKKNVLHIIMDDKRQFEPTVYEFGLISVQYH